MSSDSNLQDQQLTHPFGGCNKLLSHYETIGKSLLSIESDYVCYGYNSQRVVQQFREDVVFVSVEILQSYLEDLLDSRVSNEVLFLVRHGFWNRVDLYTIVSLFISCAVGAYVSWLGTSPVISSLVSLSLAVPVVTMWYRSPVGTLARRLSFARIVSHEISRRRGRPTTAPLKATSSFSLGELLGSSSTPESARISSISRKYFILFVLLCPFKYSALAEDKVEETVCSTVVSYTWLDGSDKEFSVVSKRVEVREKEKEQARQKLEVFLVRAKEDAMDECARKHERLSDCISSRISSQRSGLLGSSFEARKLIETAIEKDCMKDYGTCQNATETEITCIEPPVEGDEEDKGKKK